MGIFTGEKIENVEGRTWFPNINYGWDNFLSNWFTSNPNDPTGSMTIFGADAFNPANDKSGAIATARDYLTIPKNATQQKAWNAWQPMDAGTMNLADYITNKSGPDPTINRYTQNTAQYGGVGGYGLDLMHNMAQYGAASQVPAQYLNNMAQFGGTGGAGNQAMAAALQYGSPSQAAGQYVNNMAQQGIASAGSGTPLQNLAYGGPSPAMSYLQPFMNMAGAAANYRPPSVPTRQLYRNDGSGAVRLSPPVGYNQPSPF